LLLCLFCNTFEIEFILLTDVCSQIPDAVTAHYLTVAGLPPPGNGPNQTPPHLARLLALATQKFVADIAADAYQYSRIRASNSSSANNPMGGLNAAAGIGAPTAAGGAGAGGAGGVGGDAGKKGGAANTHLGIQRPGFGGGGQGGSGQGRTVLTMEDLGMAVSEYGVSVKRGEFYR
jgi:transcription initiation factor TFIID subunit 10